MLHPPPTLTPARIWDLLCSLQLRDSKDEGVQVVARVSGLHCNIHQHVLHRWAQSGGCSQSYGMCNNHSWFVTQYDCEAAHTFYNYINRGCNIVFAQGTPCCTKNNKLCF
uniref:Uncharacterized protein n=1 Tax=Eutreptiella gymnastica TaxID=73025 RepID=A0A7S1HZN5_9EUGL